MAQFIRPNGGNVDEKARTIQSGITIETYVTQEFRPSNEGMKRSLTTPAITIRRIIVAGFGFMMMGHFLVFSSTARAQSQSLERRKAAFNSCVSTALPQFEQKAEADCLKDNPNKPWRSTGLPPMIYCYGNDADPSRCAAAKSCKAVLTPQETRCMNTSPFTPAHRFHDMASMCDPFDCE
jgi:hypothetical protein